MALRYDVYRQVTGHWMKRYTLSMPYGLLNTYELLEFVLSPSGKRFEQYLGRRVDSVFVEGMKRHRERMEICEEPIFRSSQPTLHTYQDLLNFDLHW